MYKVKISSHIPEKIQYYLTADSLQSIMRLKAVWFLLTLSNPKLPLTDEAEPRQKAVLPHYLSVVISLIKFNYLLSVLPITTLNCCLLFVLRITFPSSSCMQGLIYFFPFFFLFRSHFLSCPSPLTTHCFSSLTLEAFSNKFSKIYSYKSV